MNSRFFSIAIFALGWIGPVSQPLASGQIELTKIDGSVSKFESVSVSNGMLGLPGETVDLNEYRMIDFKRAISRNAKKTVISLAGGGLLGADRLDLKDDTVQIANVAGEIKLGVEAVTHIRFKSEKLPLFDNGQPKEDLDQLVVKIEGNYQTVPGIVESISDSAIRILYEEDTIEFKLEDAFGLILAQGIEESDAGRNAMIVLTEGSEIGCKLESLNGEKATALIGDSTSIEIPVSVISRIQIRSNRLAFLSDIGPSSVTNLEGAIFGRKWKKDQNISGKILTLRDREKRLTRTFSKGLGTKSGMKLVFDNDGFDRFVSVIGIDAGTNGNGLCKVIVSSGSDILFESDVAGADVPKDLDIDIRGKTKIELRIEFGSDFLDLSDHLNWCDARFVKNPE